MKPLRATLALLVCLVAGGATRAEETGPQWDAAFPTAAAPGQVYFRAAYRDAAGGAHRLEVWREADVRLRRRTDQAIELFVEKSPAGEYAYRLVDRNRKMLISADRTALHRIGVFSDWASLAHVLEIPRGQYRIAQATRPSPETLRGDCVWRRLERLAPAAGTTDICWSSRWGLPLQIAAVTAGGRTTMFTIEAVETFAPAPEIFAVPHEGLVEIDVGGNEEVSD
jgi:hypothetical protein